MPHIPMLTDEAVVAVVDLGFIGLLLAVEFSKDYHTIGYDLSQTKVESCRRFCDPTAQVISADLCINHGMEAYVAQQTTQQLIQTGGYVKDTHATVLGLTFKENRPDLRSFIAVAVLMTAVSHAEYVEGSSSEILCKVKLSGVFVGLRSAYVARGYLYSGFCVVESVIRSRDQIRQGAVGMASFISFCMVYHP